MAVDAITTAAHLERGHGVLTMASIARNRTYDRWNPIPLAMTGRAAMQAGCSASIRNKDSESSGEIVSEQQILLRNIPNARNAAVKASSHHATRADWGRDLHGRAAVYYPVGESLKIDGRGNRIGPYRVAGRASSNLVVEIGRILLRWPNAKFRLYATKNDEQPDHLAGPEMLDEDVNPPARCDVGPIAIPDDDRARQQTMDSTDFPRRR